jgi:hypothetical protein
MSTLSARDNYFAIASVPEISKSANAGSSYEETKSHARLEYRPLLLRSPVPIAQASATSILGTMPAASCNGITSSPASWTSSRNLPALNSLYSPVAPKSFLSQPLLLERISEARHAPALARTGACRARRAGQLNLTLEEKSQVTTRIKVLLGVALAVLDPAVPVWLVTSGNDLRLVQCKRDGINVPACLMGAAQERP